MVGSAIITGSSSTVSGTPYYTSNSAWRNPNSPYYAGNFERVGASGTAEPGNTFTRLNSCPIITFPDTISIGSVVYQQNTDYWLLKDTSKTRGSAYELSGIEWNQSLGVSSSAELVLSYVYNQTPEILTAVMTSSKQICTDVMVHQADYRYIQPCITIQYAHGYDIGTINAAINTRLQTYFQNQDFGSWVDTSNLCLAIQQVLGVYNAYLTTEGTGVGQDSTNYGIQVFHNSNDTSFDQQTGTFKLGDNQVAQFLSVIIKRVATP